MQVHLVEKVTSSKKAIIIAYHDKSLPSSQVAFPFLKSTFPLLQMLTSILYTKPLS